MELQLVKPHARDQLNKDLINNAAIESPNYLHPQKYNDFFSLHNVTSNIKRLNFKYPMNVFQPSSSNQIKDQHGDTFFSNTH